MDNLEWNVSPFANTPFPWSSQLAGAAAIFDPLQELHQLAGQTPNVGMNFGRLSKGVHQSMNSTTTSTVVPDFNNNSSYDGSPMWINGDYMATNPSFDILVEEFGLAHNQLKSLNSRFTFTQDGKRPTTMKTVSVESFECLLSTTNSNTAGASGEEDGISKILSDGRKVLNFGSSSATFSSGDSQTSSNQNFATRSISLEAINNPRSIKRNSKQNELQFGGKFQNFVLSSDSSTAEGGFKLILENNPPKAKRPRSDNKSPSSTNINFQQPSSSMSSVDLEPDSEAIGKMKEMIYRAAAFRPVNLGLEVIEKPKRKNVRISSDPQTVAARQRRERISERIRVLQKLVPGGSKMDTATMLDEAANYLKFLSSQVKALENFGHKLDEPVLNNSCPYPTTNLVFSSTPLNHSFPMHNHFPHPNPNSVIHHPRS